MDFQSAMETFAEAWVAANAKTAALDPVPHQVPKKKFFFMNHDAYIAGQINNRKIR